jgi:Flp pilus assembly protein TadG
MTRLLYRPASRRLAAAQGGAVAAEFAIIFPVFFLLLFATFEFARACFFFNTLQYVVSQSARYVMTSSPGKPSNCGSSLITYPASVDAYLGAQLATYLPAATHSVTLTASNCTSSPATVQVTVKATYDFNFVLTGLMPWGPFTIKQQAVVTTPLI